MRRGFEHRLLAPYRITRDEDPGQTPRSPSPIPLIKVSPEQSDDAKPAHESMEEGCSPVPFETEDDTKSLLPEPVVPLRAMTWLPRGDYERVISS